MQSENYGLKPEIREKEPFSALLAIIIAIAAIGCFVFVVVIQRLQTIQNEVTANQVAPVDVSGWTTYQNTQYGFELEYPPDWTLSTDGLTGQTPFIAIGNPLEGTKTYVLQVFIESNPNVLASGDYAHTILNSDRAQDLQNASSGVAPQVTPKFDKAYVLTVGGYPAYELYNVFESDHNAERIYVAHGDEALQFDFPSAEENQNLFLPAANNNVAHAIINTLVFTN